MRSVFSALHWLVWRDPRRRARTLLRFAEVEADGGRDLVRAAEVTGDPLLRRLFLKHDGIRVAHQNSIEQRRARSRKANEKHRVAV